VVGIQVRGPAGHLNLDLDSDGLPEIVWFADLNQDGIRDIGLVLEDESAVQPIIVLVTSGSLALPATVPPDLWRRAQVGWTHMDAVDACTDSLRPRVVERVGARPLVRVATGQPRNVEECLSPKHLDLEVVGDTVVLAQP